VGEGDDTVARAIGMPRSKRERSTILRLGLVVPTALLQKSAIPGEASWLHRRELSVSLCLGEGGGGVARLEQQIADHNTQWTRGRKLCLLGSPNFERGLSVGTGQAPEILAHDVRLVRQQIHDRAKNRGGSLLPTCSFLAPRQRQQTFRGRRARRVGHATLHVRGPARLSQQSGRFRAKHSRQAEGGIQGDRAIEVTLRARVAETLPVIDAKPELCLRGTRRG